MKIGYTYLNRSIRDIRLQTFRLLDLTEEKLFKVAGNNLHYLGRILKYNAEHGIRFFRIHSDTIPFASHPKCTFDWQAKFEDRLKHIGSFIRRADIRISMHPGRYMLLNSPRSKVLNNTLAELRYHADFLDLMELDTTAKIQIQVGGAYGNKVESLERFINRLEKVEQSILRRLTIENDDTNYSVAEIIEVHRAAGIPVVLDILNHKVLSNGESLETAIAAASSTWSKEDGILMTNYSSQQPGGPKGRHSNTLNDDGFRKFLHQTGSFDFDLMLDTRDKERSAHQALRIANEEKRLINNDALLV